jgi:porin
MFNKLIGAGFLVLFLAVNSAWAEGFLLKSQRDSLAEKGLSFDLHSIADHVSVLNGGSVHRSSWVGRFDFVVDVDTEKAGLYKGGTLHIDVMNAGGGGLKPTGEMVGDLQGVNNIEAPKSTRLFEAWYEQSLLDGKLSAKAGLHDVNSEFAASENGAP